MLFIYKIVPYRENFISTITQAEDDIISSHFDYLNAYYKQGKIKMVGRCNDGAYGIAIFEADDLAEAEKFTNSDPAVKAGVMKADVHAFKIVLE